MKISFVILHYLTINDTIECIESILNNIVYESLDIVIVDNGSTNNTGTELEDIYSSTNNVYILKNKENLGFAKGNNIGFQFAKNKLNSDFIVMANNDTIFNQKDFCVNLIEVYNKEKYDICGPEIISLIDHKNQNPVPKIFNKIEQVKKMKKKFKLLLLLSYFRFDDVFIKLLNRKHINNTSRNIENTDIQLHGSCLIFSPDYIKKYQGLHEETFMYLEECILKYISERDNLKMIYSERITMYHKEDSATNVFLDKGYKKNRFYYKNSIESCQILINLMNK